MHYIIAVIMTSAYVQQLSYDSVAFYDIIRGDRHKFWVVVLILRLRFY